MIKLLRRKKQTQNEIKSPTSVEDRIKEILIDLLSYDEIYACMLVRKNLEGILPSTKLFKKEIEEIWEILYEVMDKFFEIVEQYSKYGYGLNEIYFRIQEYEVMFFIIPETDTALVAIVPELANKGLIEITLETARLNILKYLT